MPSPQDVEDRLRSLPAVKAWGGRHEMAAIARELALTEQIENGAVGYVTGRMGVLVATDARVLFFTGGSVPQVPINLRYDRLVSVDVQAEGALRTVVLTSPSGSVTLELQPSTSTLIPLLRSRAQQQDSVAPAPVPATAEVESSTEGRALPSLLGPGETVIATVRGSYNERLGLLAATDRRLLFVRKTLMGKLTVEDFPYEKVTSLQYETGLIFGAVKIFASGNTAEIRQTVGAETKRFADLVRAQMSTAGHSGAAPPPATVPDLTAQLERLAGLKAAGHLSDEEFAAAKSRLLA